MLERSLTRRTMLTGFGAAGISGIFVGPACNRADAAPRDPEEALARLKEGNRRFVAGETRCAHQAADWRRHLASGQQPIATILGCSDSRVPPELVFDQGFGDLFVIRVAGNVIEPAVFGSIDYAVEHLQTVLLVVLGHERCGAVTAALDGLYRNKAEVPEIESLLKYVKQGVREIDPTLPPDQQVRLGVEANVRFAMSQVAQSPEGQKAVQDGRIQITGGVYELETGNVRFLD